MNKPIVMTDERTRATSGRGSAQAAWRSLGWFGAVLAAIGMGQLVIYFYPPGFGSAEWEFGAMAQTLGALPLPTMGLAAMVAAAVALGSRSSLIALTLLLVALAIAVLVVLAMFWSVVPMALRAAPEPVSGAVRQTIARSTLSGVGFTVLYLGAAVVAARRAKR